MRITAFLAAFAIAAISQLVHANEDPLAPAKAGKLWCYEPDSENRTCRSFSRFEWDAAGSIWEEDELTLSANPLVTMKVRAISTHEGVAICQVIVEETFQKAMFMVDGKPATADEDMAFREQYGSRYAPFYGKKFCLEISPYESIFITQVAIDGTPYPSATSRLKWISPDEGYVLAP
jgi:hypothetical protein